MICYVVPPTAQQFDSSAAEISFNGSIPANPNDININDVTGVDTSRYTADVSGLTVSSSRPGIRLTISPYQSSDGDTNFGCHGVYTGGVPSYSLISGFPQVLAGLLCLFGLIQFNGFIRSSFLSSCNSLSDRHQLF